MRPVEGTILTVIREAADYMGVFVDENPDCDIEKYFELLHLKAEDALQYTPELLPVLKEVGVVDSGGAGLVAILEGFDLVLRAGMSSLPQRKRPRSRRDTALKSS